MFPPTDSAKNTVDMFPTTDKAKDINAVLSSHVECLIVLYLGWLKALVWAGLPERFYWTFWLYYFPLFVFMAGIF